ncbi:MAG: hypothetical protein Q9163_000085 [Psora crenata]
MGRHSTNIVDGLTPKNPSTRKRKREGDPNVEIEVDVTAPEPPSRKSLRRVKKGKGVPCTLEDPEEDAHEEASERKKELSSGPANSNRSPFGIWIGNLPWAATKPDLRNFLTQNLDISEDTITRIHMPAPSKSIRVMPQQRLKLQNKGFAYVDFSTQLALDKALTLSEKLFTGRRVLIKDSKSFEGRPETVKADGVAAGTMSGNPPSKRVFVGNLTFDTTKEDLSEHFKLCGDMEDLHIATFEDSGKCKGYAWVDFAKLEGAEAAVRGWINYKQQREVEDNKEDLVIEDGISKTSGRSAKPRKWWVNKLQGRLLRMEFAEDKAVRYKKRFSKGGGAQHNGTRVVSEASGGQSAATPARGGSSEVSRKRKPLEKVDVLNIKPGATPATEARLSGAIVADKGKKTVFR